MMGLLLMVSLSMVRFWPHCDTPTVTVVYKQSDLFEIILLLPSCLECAVGLEQNEEQMNAWFLVYERSSCWSDSA